MNIREMWKQRKIWVLLTGIIFVACVCLAWIVGKSNSREDYLQNVQSEKIHELKEAEGLYSEDSIVLNDTTKEQAEAIAEKIGGKLRMTEDGSYAVIYLPKDMTVEEIYESEEYSAFLEEMSLDYYANTSAVDANNNELFPSRPDYSVSDVKYVNQQYLDYINLKDSWNVSKGNGVRVAVIDTGIDTDHEEFAGKISDKSYNATTDQLVSDYGLEVVEDEDGHGTAVAGVISATMNNTTGIAGVAPEAELVIIKCETDASGEFARGSDLVFGLAYAIECDVDVINMSFRSFENIYAKYTKLAVDSDIICVAAAGNDGNGMLNYPAADENVIGVGALETIDWSLAPYSNFGENSDVLAPGTVYTTTIGGEYGYKTGTSMSCPIITAAVAMYLSSNPTTEYSEIYELIKASSVDVGTLGEDWYYGYGLLDIYALVCEEKGTITYEMLTDEVDNQTQVFVKGHTIQYMPEPERENVVFDGWYYDIECTDECEYYTDVFTSDVTLYAKWINEDEGSAYTYSVLDDGTVEIQSYTGKRRYLTVPSVIEGRTVSSIGADTFAHNSRIRTISLPSTITNIGDRAFYYCTALRGMDIPENVARIGAYAFSGCVRLNSVGIAANGALAVIGEEAFSQCGIMQIAIPANVTSIGNRVFVGSTSLRKVTVEEGNNAYQIISDALYDTTGNTLMYYPAALGGEYVINEDTVKIADSAFAYGRLSGVTLPDGLESIADKGFMSSGIRSIQIPESVSKLGKNVFSNCSYLNSVVFSENSQCTMLSDGVFENCQQLQQIQIPASIKEIGMDVFSYSRLKEITFADGSKLEKIRERAFWHCPLQKVEIPENVISIGKQAFAYCNELSSLNFARDSQCESIGREAFTYCRQLEKVEFPDSLKMIEKLAFYESGLVNVEIGAGLVEMEDGVFAGCHRLTSFVVAEENPVFASYDDVLFTGDKTELLLYPGAREGAYTLPEETTLVRGYAFASAEGLTEVHFNSGLQEIGEYAFSGCISMVTPTLPAQLETIGANAFEYCSSMTDKLVLPKSVISVGRYAFYNDYDLTEIVVEPESEMSRIGYGAFAYCGIKDFTIPGNVATMAQEVFTGCKNLLTVTYEADSRLENLAAWTFEGADELRQITFEEGSALSLIEARACQGLDKLEKVDLTYCTKLNKVGNYAFNHCKSLSSIVLPTSVTEIGRYAFNGCTSMTKSDIPKTVNFIGRYAFAGTGNIEVFFKSSVLPADLEENWDYDVAGYYMGVSGIQISGDWTYALTEDNKASVISYNGTDANIVLDTLDGYEVVSIGGKAFYNNTTLQSISLPDSLTGIYQAAFAGTTSLVSITIPANVTVIDNEAFRGSGIEMISFADGSKLSTLGRYTFAETANLSTVTLPDGVTKIRDYTFYDSNLSQIIFGADTVLTEIGRYAFAKSAIQSVILPEKLEKIDYYAFSENDSLSSVQFGTGTDLQIFGNAFYRSALTSVTIPENVSYIGELCFTGCESLTDITVAEANENYSSIDGILFDKAARKLITCPAGKTGSYEVANTVTTLAFAAFEDSKLSEVILPEDSQLSTIGYRAFYNCKNLTSINIPAGVQSIENYAFANDENLETVTVAADSQLGGIYKNAFYNCAKLTGFEIPAGVQEISDYAFYGCSAMSNVQLAENSQLKGVYEHAFEYSGITEFVMPENLQEVGAYAFRGAKVATLVCNESVTDIGDYAFADCGLADTTVLTIPGTVEYLGKSALQGAVTLEELTIPFLGTYEDDLWNGELHDLFGASYLDASDLSLHTVHVLKGTSVPQLAFEGLHSLKTVSLPDSIVSIGPEAFVGCSIETIELPNQLQEIGTGAFERSNIQSVILPDTVETIGADAFWDCGQLQEIVFSDSLTSIGAQAFRGTAIDTVELSGKVVEIGAAAFSSCKNLESIMIADDNPNYASLDGILYDKKYTKIITVPAKLSGKVIVPEGVTLIEDYAFSGVGISEISLPDTLEEIGEGAFYQAKQLEKITIPDSVTTMGRDCFGYATNLREVVLGAGIQTVESLLFNGCEALETVELPEGITTIKEQAFHSCLQLQNITIPKTVTVIEDEAFNLCNSLAYINIPENVEQIGQGVFLNCDTLCCVDVDENNANYSSVDGILYDKECTRLVFIPCNIAGDIVIPEGVEILENLAFSSRSKITSVVLPQSLKNIGRDCFANCIELDNIVLGNNIEVIGAGAFKGTKYSYNESNWENGVLYIGQYLIEVNLDITSLNVKEGTSLIGDSAAAFCDKLQKVILPDSVKYINEFAFADCSNLQKFYNSNNLQKIGTSAFSRCSKLRNIVIPKSLNDIGHTPFNNCNSLNYIRMETDLLEKEDSIFFYNCPGVEWLYIPKYQDCLWMLFDAGVPKGVIIGGETEEDLDGPFYEYGPFYDDGLEVYCKLNEAEVTQDRGDNIYYKSEWNLSTFYVDGMIVQMIPIKLAEVVQTPASTLVAEYLPAGATLAGWDIDGDGAVDKLPATLTEDLEAYAVYDVPISGISTDEAIELAVGRTKTLEITCTPEEYTHSNEVTWESSDESIAVVDEIGVVTAIAEGTAVITATLKENSEIQTTCDVTVIPIQYGIKLDETSGEMNVGETEELAVEFVLPEDDTEVTTWESSDETVATINDGVITALAPGNTSIHIVHGSYSEYYYLTVKAPLQSVSLNVTEVSMNKNDTKQLEVTYNPANTTDSKDIIWYSTNANVARVNAEGLITAVGPGTATVTGILGNMEVTCKVTVLAPIEWIVLNTTTGTMRIDRTKPLEVIYEPSNTTDDKTAAWSSSDEVVASVDENGVVTAHEAGTAVITATVGEHTATYTVTVVGIKDKDTGIIITNSDDTSMDENISMDVEEMDTETIERDYKTAWERFLEFLRKLYEEAVGHKEMTTVFDISLFQENVTIQPDKTVDVEIPVPEDMLPEDVVIYRMEEDGTITDMHVEYVDGRFRFKTDHFSVYAIGAKSKTIYVDSIALSQENVSLCLNQTTTINAVTVPETAENSKVVWTSADETIATVDANGVITAIAEGTVEITATVVDNGGASAVCTVTVGHAWNDGEVTKKATCTGKGERTYICTNCPATKTEEVAELGHEYSEEWTVDKEASCTEAGSKSHHCTREKCTEKIDVTAIPVVEHAWNAGEVTKEATCTGKGEKTYICTNCPATKTEEVAELGHEYSEEWTVDKEASCTEAGSKSHHCTRENCTERTDVTVISTVEHSYDKGVITNLPTCVDKGKKLYTCAICKQSKTEEIVATGVHAFGDWTQTKEAQCDKLGEKVRTCVNCAHQETEHIPATGFVKGGKFTKSNHVYTIKTVKGKKGTVVYEGSTKNNKKTVTIPKTVKMKGKTYTVIEIGDKAFKGNTKIKGVTIPEGVTKIGKEAFSGCKNLKTITIKSTKLQAVGKNAIKGINKKATIKVPKKQYRKYKKLLKSKTGYKKTMKIKK